MNGLQLHTVAVIGGGMMGRSIATRVSQAGMEVIIGEISAARVDEVRIILEDALAHEIERWGLTQSEKKAILARITFTHDLAGVGGANLVIETITEDFEAKRALLLELDPLVPPEVPIIINTSTLSVSELAAGLDHPERVLGMHFSYPATTTRVVEVVRGQLTAEGPFAEAKAFARLIGKTPVEEFESPGFVTSRVLMAMVNECAYVVLEGVTSAAEADLAMKLAFESRLGPLEWADRTGVHKVLRWLEYMFRETGSTQFRPCPLIRKLARSGRTGAAVGRGFFTYDGEGVRTDRLPDDTPSLG